MGNRKIKLFHIIHIDRLDSIILNENIWSDSEMSRRSITGSEIGMKSIKKRRLTLKISRYPDLCVGDCVPFYFSPRSVMLFMFYKDNNLEITYHGGQEPILHLVGDLERTVDWARHNNLRWVFTDSNAGSNYFNDYDNLAQLSQLNWQAINTRNWTHCREQKQAEFLLEHMFPWYLVEDIGVYSETQYYQVNQIIDHSDHKPTVRVIPEWYY